MLYSYMDTDELRIYAKQQMEQLDCEISMLDKSWGHHSVIENWCQKAKREVEQLIKDYKYTANNYITENIERKTEKYTHWVEVMRLALFQYSRFTEKRSARSEALYSTLCSLATTWAGINVENIVIPGCGPGRSVLDFGRIYPTAEVVGLDYSLLALTLADTIINSNEKSYLLQRDICSGDNISKKYSVNGFGLNNTKLGLVNLITNPIPKCDMLICSNTINLLPDHKKAVKSISDSVRPGGIVVYADLLGWRLDREINRRSLNDDLSIKRIFEENGFETLDMFSGVPYIETESDDQETCYNEHFYVGRRR